MAAKAKTGKGKKAADLTARKDGVKGGRIEVTREQWEKLAATKDFQK